MRRLSLTSAATVLAFLLLVPPAWAEWVWPAHGEVITPYRNGTDPYASGQHRGIDIAAATGTTVVAAAGGEVRFAGTAGSSGLTVSVRTADGRYDTSYLHLSSTSVREGDRVAAGQRLATVGTTGTRSATAPHLHFGVRDAGSRHAYHDPLGFLPPPTATQPPRGAPAPEPAPVPVSPAPAPAPATGRIPVRAPVPGRVPVRTPSPRRVPAGEPRRAPAGEPRRVPAGAPRPVPAGEPRHVPAGKPRHVPAGEPRHVPAEAARPVPIGKKSPLELPAGAALPRAALATVQHQERAPLHIPSPDGASPGASAQRDARLFDEGPGEGPAPSTLGKESAGASPDRRGAPGSTHLNPSSSGPDLGLLAACLGLLAAAALLGLTGDGRKATRETRHRIARVLQPMLGRR
jgi:Peptidase family M23